jgi:hypothetical protein
MLKQPTPLDTSTLDSELLAAQKLMLMGDLSKNTVVKKKEVTNALIKYQKGKQTQNKITTKKKKKKKKQSKRKNVKNHPR